MRLCSCYRRLIAATPLRFSCIFEDGNSKLVHRRFLRAIRPDAEASAQSELAAASAQLRAAEAAVKAASSSTAAEGSLATRVEGEERRSDSPPRGGRGARRQARACCLHADNADGSFVSSHGDSSVTFGGCQSTAASADRIRPGAAGARPTSARSRGGAAGAESELGGAHSPGAMSTVAMGMASTQHASDRFGSAAKADDLGAVVGGAYGGEIGAVAASAGVGADGMPAGGRQVSPPSALRPSEYPSEHPPSNLRAPSRAPSLASHAAGPPLRRLPAARAPGGQRECRAGLAKGVARAAAADRPARRGAPLLATTLSTSLAYSL